MQKITSRDNAKLKHARKVRDGRARELVFVEGLRLAEEALRSGAEIAEVFVAEHFAKNERAAALLDAAARRRLPVAEVAAAIFDSVADTKTSQGVVLLAARPESGRAAFETRFARENKSLPIVVLLHEIGNPSNLGAVLRTAEAVDAAGVVVSRGAADAFSPKSLRASMGAGFRLNLWTNADFTEVLRWARENGLISTAADVRAEKSYAALDWTRPRLLAFGSEAHGLAPEDFQKIDEGLVIPMENAVESLNLAVSAGVILFEAKRQREEGKLKIQS